MSTSAEMVELLRHHYLPTSRPPSGELIVEVGSPCGRRRADAIWAPLVAAQGSGLVGHEIKVARSDVLTELADPAKADPWMKYCHQWWLTVASPAMVEGLSVPDAWGIMVPPSGRRTRSMTILRPAPQLNPMEPAVAWRRLYGRRALGEDGTYISRVADLDQREKSLERRQAALVEQQRNMRPGSLDGQRCVELIERLRGALQPRYFTDENAVDLLIEVAADLSQARSVTREQEVVLTRTSSRLADIIRSLSAAQESAAALTQDAAGTDPRVTPERPRT